MFSAWSNRVVQGTMIQTTFHSDEQTEHPIIILVLFQGRVTPQHLPIYQGHEFIKILIYIL